MCGWFLVESYFSCFYIVYNLQLGESFYCCFSFLVPGALKNPLFNVVPLHFSSSCGILLLFFDVICLFDIVKLCFFLLLHCLSFTTCDILPLLYTPCTWLATLIIFFLLFFIFNVIYILRNSCGILQLFLLCMWPALLTLHVVCTLYNTYFTSFTWYGIGTFLILFLMFQNFSWLASYGRVLLHKLHLIILCSSLKAALDMKYAPSEGEEGGSTKSTCERIRRQRGQKLFRIDFLNYRTFVFCIILLVACMLNNPALAVFTLHAAYYLVQFSLHVENRSLLLLILNFICMAHCGNDLLVFLNCM